MFGYFQLELCKYIVTDGLNQNSSFEMQLWQNTPNPCNEKTNIQYMIPTGGEIYFELVNIFGESIYKFQNIETQGIHNFNLDISNLASGIYYYSILFKGNKLSKRIIILNQ